MIGAFQATLYDLFGYFFPGAVGLVAIGLIFWTLFHASDFVNLAEAGDGFVISVFIVAAYICGHVLHGLGNRFVRPNRRHEQALTTTPRLSRALRRLIDAQLVKQLGADAKRMLPMEKYGFMDEARALTEQEGNRDVYIYREGFYIGMTVATGLLGLGLLSRVFIGESCVVFPTGAICTSWLETLLLALMAAIACSVFRKSIERFTRYRVERAALLWLVKTNKEDAESKPERTKPSPEVIKLFRMLWKDLFRHGPPRYRSAFRGIWRQVRSGKTEKAG